MHSQAYSGHAAVSDGRNTFVVDNATDGFDLYRLDTGCFILNFSTGVPTKRYPKQVEFGEDCRVVVGGSDHGVVYVFDRKTGAVLDVLRHAERGLVQTITVSRFRESHPRRKRRLTICRRIPATIETRLSAQRRVPATRSLSLCGSTVQRGLRILLSASALSALSSRYSCKF